MQVKDIFYHLIIDACRETLDGSSSRDGFCGDLNPIYAQCVDRKELCSRGMLWSLAAGTNRGSLAGRHSNAGSSLEIGAFIAHVISEDCGLFEPNTPVKTAFNRACEKLRRVPSRKLQNGDVIPQQVPLILMDNIPDNFCLHEEHSPGDRFDICLCYRRDKDLQQASFIHDHVAGVGTVHWGLIAGEDPEMQIARATCNSSIFILVISEHTFEDINALHGDGDLVGGHTHLANFLRQMDMILEMYEHYPESMCILPVFLGEEQQPSGSPKIVPNADSQANRPACWPNVSQQTVWAPEVRQKALRYLRRFNKRLAPLLHDQFLRETLGFKDIPSLRGGRHVADTLKAFQILEPITSMKGRKEDAGNQIADAARRALAKIQLTATSIAPAAAIVSGHGRKRGLEGGDWNEVSSAGEPSSKRPRDDSGIAGVSSSASEINKHKDVFDLFKRYNSVLKAYLKEFSESYGQHEDSASGNMMQIDKQYIFVKTALFEYSSHSHPVNASCSSEQEDGHGQRAAGGTPNTESQRHRIQQMENTKRNGAEGEEERRMFLRRMGYGAGAGADALVRDVHGNGKIVDSVQKLLHMLLKGQFLCLLGPPACGKTVTMLHVACAAAAAAQKCVDGGLQQGALLPRIPLFMRGVELSTLLAGDSKPPMRLEELVKGFIAYKYPHAKYPNVAEVLEGFLKLRRVLIIIDGLDEAAGNRSMIEQIIDETAAAKDVCLIISTRDYVFETSRMEHRLRQFEPLRILLLDEQQRNLLIGRRLPDSQEALHFGAQLQAVSQQIPEMVTSPFLLALTIEVSKNDSNHKIPTNRCDLYEKQVEVTLVRHKCFRQLTVLLDASTHRAAGSFKSLRGIAAHIIFHDNTYDLFRQANLNSECLAALKSSLRVDTGGEPCNVAKSVESLHLKAIREFLEVLAFICQIKLKRRDFRWDSEDVQKHMQTMWRRRDFSFTVMGRFLLDLYPVGIVSKVGDGQIRFSHLTLQEYLAASYAVRLFGNDPQNLLNELRPLHSRWNREVLQFAACMPQLNDKMFEKFCRLVLKSDDGTGVHCELVQDVLKERGASEKVKEMVRSRLQEIRGINLLIAGLCHPSLELRNHVLCEMKKFRTPLDPFKESNDGTVAKLKNIIKKCHVDWNTRAAAILSVAQIAQMDHCQMGTERHDTLFWVLDMLGSHTQDDTHFALVTSLGICLKGVGKDVAGVGCIILSSSDEQQLLFYLDRTLNDKDRSINGPLEALADVKVYSKGLVDWVVRKSLIETGQWPSRHVLLFCGKTTTSSDCKGATCLCRQLLVRVHALSVEAFEKEEVDVLKGLSLVLALIKPFYPIYGLSFVLYYLRLGQAYQRVRMLCVASSLKMQFAPQILGDFARCLLFEAGDDTKDQSLLTYFLVHEYNRYESELERKTFSAISMSFCYLQTVMRPAALHGGAPQEVAKQMNEFELNIAQRSRQREQDRATRLAGSSSRVDATLVQHQESQQFSRLDSKQTAEQKAQHDSIETLALAVKTFTPTMLKTPVHDAAKLLRVSQYCAARLWATSGLIQPEDVDTPYSQSIVDFENLCALRDPWIAGYGQDDGRWEHAVCNMMQNKVLGLGRLLFSMVLLHIQKTIQSHPDAAMDKLKLLETKIEQWKSSDETSGDAAQQLEQRYLLKELRIGCRSQQLMLAGPMSEQSEASVLVACDPGRKPMIIGFFTKIRLDMHVMPAEAQIMTNLFSEGRSVLDVQVHVEPTFEMFKDVLLNARRNNVRILHVAGDGRRACGFFWKKQSVTTEYEQVPIDQFTKIFNTRGSTTTWFGSLECVVLNSCQTEPLGKGLRSYSVPNVICWRSQVDDNTATYFVGNFYYKALDLKPGDCKLAFQETIDRMPLARDLFVDMVCLLSKALLSNIFMLKFLPTSYLWNMG